MRRHTFGRLFISAIAGLALAGCTPITSQSSAVSTDIVLADFEQAGYSPGWLATGSAFGPGPTSTPLPGQQPVDGFVGRGYATSYFGGDQATGTLTSPPFQINRRFITFLVGGGELPGTACMNLIVNDQIVRTSTGHARDPDGTEHLSADQWDVSDLTGRSARIQVVDNATGSWGHVNVDQITMTDTPLAGSGPVTPGGPGWAAGAGGAGVAVGPVTNYQEQLRPLFHFTAGNGWINDPNGLVFYDGEYHLFFQHNPTGNRSGNLHWGHAIGTDLFHWAQVPEAIEPDAMGQIWSGSAVVDWHNTAGLQQGGEKTLVAFYTAAGRPFTQCMTYSTDKGRTWTKYDRNPVVRNIHAQNRDPKVVWHAETNQWVMALYLDRPNQYELLTSRDMKRWELSQTLTLPGADECPDFFPMDVDGRGQRKWVFTGANGRYVVGSFDGRQFQPETGPLVVEYGDSYAVQTFSDVPQADGRRIQIGWMRNGRFPGMPFNQQLSVPCELVLRSTSEGPRLFKTPVRELGGLLESTRVTKPRLISAAPIDLGSGEALDIKAEIEPGPASEINFDIGGTAVTYDVRRQTLINGRPAPLPLINGRFKLRLLIDRASIEAFGNDGQSVISSSVNAAGTVRLSARGGGAKIIGLSVSNVRPCLGTAQ